MSRYWWVNLGKTFRLAIADGFIWCPQAGGRTYSQALWHWQTMHRVVPGDIVFGNWDGAIRALGVAQSHSRESAKPEEGFEFDWQSIGWRVDVAFRELTTPISPKAIADELLVFRPDKYSPITRRGTAGESYLSEVPAQMAGVLLSRVDHSDMPDVSGASGTQDLEAVREAEDDRHEGDLRKSPESVITSVEKEVLVQARRGQGLFRKNVERFESACKVTGLQERQFLHACHIKPWRVSTRAEKVDGNNGLLLSPHVHMLFDRGLITFSEMGVLEASASLAPKVQEAWAIKQARSAARLTDAQNEFLEFHRRNVFVSS